MKERKQSAENHMYDVDGRYVATEPGCWRRGENNVAPGGDVNITCFVKVQTIQWSGRVKRRPDSADVKAAVDWGSTGKGPKGRPKKRWLDGVKRDREKLQFFFEVFNRTQGRIARPRNTVSTGIARIGQNGVHGRRWWRALCERCVSGKKLKKTVFSGRRVLQDGRTRISLENDIHHLTPVPIPLASNAST